LAIQFIAAQTALIPATMAAPATPLGMKSTDPKIQDRRWSTWLTEISAYFGSSAPISAKIVTEHPVGQDLRGPPKQKVWPPAVTKNQELEL